MSYYHSLWLALLCETLITNLKRKKLVLFQVLLPIQSMSDEMLMNLLSRCRPIFKQLWTNLFYFLMSKLCKPSDFERVVKARWNSVIWLRFALNLCFRSKWTYTGNLQGWKSLQFKNRRKYLCKSLWVKGIVFHIHLTCGTPALHPLTGVKVK